MAPTSKICRTDIDEKKERDREGAGGPRAKETEKEREREVVAKPRKSLRLSETPRGKNVNAILSCLQCRSGTRAAYSVQRTIGAARVQRTCGPPEVRTCPLRV